VLSRPARLSRAARVVSLGAEWPICRNFLPLAGRPAREALPRRPSAGVHLPATPPGVRLRAGLGGRAAHAPLGRADTRRGRRQPAREVRPDARRTEARGHRRMTPPAGTTTPRTARPTR